MNSKIIIILSIAAAILTICAAIEAFFQMKSYKLFGKTKFTKKMLEDLPLPEGLSAEEIALILSTIDNSNLLAGGSSFPPLAQIYKTLWTIRMQLLDLLHYARILRGDYDLELLSAIDRFVGIWDRDAVPVLALIVRNPNTCEEIRKEAIDRLKEFGIKNII